MPATGNRFAPTRAVTTEGGTHSRGGEGKRGPWAPRAGREAACPPKVKRTVSEAPPGSPAKTAESRAGAQASAELARGRAPQLRSWGPRGAGAAARTWGASGRRPRAQQGAASDSRWQRRVTPRGPGTLRTGGPGTDGRAGSRAGWPQLPCARCQRFGNTAVTAAQRPERS